MSRAVHCDLAGCDTWAVVGSLPSMGWLEIREDGAVIGDYCCGAHAWRDLADTYDPLEEVPA